MRRSFVAAVVCLVAATTYAQSTVSGRIVAIADGDTPTLLDATKTQYKIRIDGIDAPEKGQAFGQRSKESMSDLAFGRNAFAECHKVDRFRREVCKVLVGGTDVGLEQIRRGLAWHFKRYMREQSATDRAAYADAEIEARSARRGLWRDKAPIAPCEWRKANRPASAASSP